MSEYGIVKNGTRVVTVPDYRPTETEAGSPVPDNDRTVGGTFNLDDATYLAKKAGEIVVIGTQLQTAVVTLKRISEATELGDGDSLDDLRKYAGQFSEQFTPLSDNLISIGSALLIYAYGLEWMIPQCVRLSERMPELWPPIWQANEERETVKEKNDGQYGPFDPESEQGKEIYAAQAALDKAVANWDAKGERIDTLWASWIDLHQVANNAVSTGLDDLRWDDVINETSDKIYSVAKWIAKYAGIVSLVPVPGVQEVFGGIALTAGGVALYISIDQAIDGTGTWGDVVTDGIDVIPVTDIALLKDIAKIPGVAEQLVRAGGKGLDVDDAALRALVDKWKRQYGHAVRTEGLSDERIKDSLAAFLEQQVKAGAGSRVPKPDQPSGGDVDYPTADETEELRREAERIARRRKRD
ncbi:hypothetical protein [Microbacterium sp. LWH12-1.2]|uniref:hypothetical protein n=1 Tax=Microbacterium sp. LWH12-1.2 TaxID=3135259 RepID=UPI003422BC7E